MIGGTSEANSGRRRLLAGLLAAPLVASAAMASAGRDDPIPAAWATFKDARRRYDALPLDHADEDRLLAIMDQADEVLLAAVATTPASAAMKLRRIFMWHVTARFGSRLALGEDTPALRRDLGVGDMFDRMLWSTIEGLAGGKRQLT